jgi:hypothetical protein
MFMRIKLTLILSKKKKKKTYINFLLSKIKFYK